MVMRFGGHGFRLLGRSPAKTQVSVIQRGHLHGVLMLCGSDFPVGDFGERRPGVGWVALEPDERADDSVATEINARIGLHPGR